MAVDGVVRGETPLSGPLILSAGKHTIRVSKAGYTKFLDVLTIRSRHTEHVRADLFPVSGILVVRASAPKAKVFLDGAYIGLAPTEAEALIGARTIRVSLAGFYDAFFTRHIVAGKRDVVEATLKPLPAALNPYHQDAGAARPWFRRWYVWTGAAALAVAVTLAIVLPVTMAKRNPCPECDFSWTTKRAALISF